MRNNGPAIHTTWVRRLACALTICAVGRAAWADAPLTAQAAQQPAQAVSAMLDADTKEVQSGLKAANDAQETFTVTVQKPQKEGAPSPLARQLAAEAKIELSAAAGCAKEAENLRKQASAFTDTNPAYAERLQGMALRKFEEAKQWMGRANSALGIAPTGAQGQESQMPPAQLQNFCKEACQQLRKIAGQSNDSPGLPSFDEKAPPATVQAPSVPPADTFFKGRVPTPAHVKGEGTIEVLVLPQGAQVDLSPLRAAVAKVDPKAAHIPLFRNCGAGDASCPSNELLRFLADPRVAAALRTIGGVELDATFDVLSVAGFSELRGGPKIRFVEKPVLISLKALLHAVSPYSHPDAWSKLPDALRHPGSVDRINGYILDPNHQDIVLIGQTASVPANLIDIDEIVLAIRQVWRDGKIMAISLDPRPDDIGGPQYPRFIGTPPDSMVAKIMVEADYSMKAIMNDAGFAHGLGIVDVKGITQTVEASHRDFLARFWLTPKYLGAESIYDSASGRTTLLETQVQTRTEELLLRNGALEGTGQHATIAEREANVLTAKYSELETTSSLQPMGVFKRLHGLVDLVTIAKIWRVRSVEYGFLDQFSRLPYRPLTGAETLPSAYPGLSSTLELDGQVRELSGGVQLAQRQSANSAHTYNDHISEDLEKAVDDQRAEAAVARAVSLSFALPAGADDVNPVEDALLDGNAALRQGELDRAYAAFGRVVEIAPSEPQGYAGLAYVELNRGKPLLAAPLAIQAMQLAPDDIGYRLIGLDVAWRIDPKAAYAANDDATRQELSRYYVQLAGVANAKGQLEDVERYADWATELWEDNAVAHTLRAFVRDSASLEREQLMARAVRAYRHQLASGTAEARQPLAVALVMSSCDHISRAFGRLGVSTRGALTEVGVTQALAFVRHGVAEARQAVEIDPNLPVAAAQSLAADALLGLLTDAAENRAHGREFIDRGTALLAKFPKNAEIHMALAEVFQMIEDFPTALRELDEAITIEPSNVRAHAVRAEFRARSGNCQGAIADVDMVRTALQGQPKLAEKFGAVPERCR
jgi:tetratricopeptide (TPR) repeat protein